MTETDDSRKLDAAALRAMAHPLRVDLYESLSAYGPDTASGLAERLGESSGATSYHLRQLAKNGLVREIPGRGTGRERWWERTPGGVSVSVYDHDTAAGKAAALMVSRQWERSRAQLLAEFQDRAEEVGREWFGASVMDTMNLSLTFEQLTDLGTAFQAFYEEHIEPLRRRSDPGARRVQIHFNAFPIVDAPAPIPEGE